MCVHTKTWKPRNQPKRRETTQNKAKPFTFIIKLAQITNCFLKLS